MRTVKLQWWIVAMTLEFSCSPHPSNPPSFPVDSSACAHAIGDRNLAVQVAVATCAFIDKDAPAALVRACQQAKDAAKEAQLRSVLVCQ
jgi:hypothetical protein